MIAEASCRRLFTRDCEVASFYAIVKWWELRRLPYNILVGVTGLITCTVLVAVAAIASERVGEPLGLPDPPIFALLGILLFGIGANVCSTGGWVVEWLVRQLWKDRAGVFGQISFCLGVAFSILLALFPAVAFSALLIIRILLQR